MPTKKSTLVEVPVVEVPVVEVPVVEVPVVEVPVLSLLATLQAAAPSVATSAQLASAIATVQGHYAAIQNGIAAPTRGTSCIAVWCVFCAYCVANKTVPTLTQLAPQLSAVNATTQSVQFYKVKKYFGL